MTAIVNPTVRLALACVLAVGGGACDAAGDASVVATGAATAASPMTEPKVLDELPLDRGYYVRTDESCADATPAGVQLLRRAGLQWVTSRCLFDRIEQTGATTYSVTQSCGDHMATETATAIYEIADRTSFAFKDGNGWEHAARLCPQRELPAPWRDEDIRDLID